MECYIKVHKQGTQTVVGVCDIECVGKTLKKGKFCFDVSSQFFQDQIVKIEDAIKVLKLSDNCNIVGAKIIQAAIEHDIIHQDGVMEIDGIPIALKFAF